MLPSLRSATQRPAPPRPTPASPQQPSCTFLWSARRATGSFPSAQMTRRGCACNLHRGPSSRPRAWGPALLCAPHPQPLPSRPLLHVGSEPQASLQLKPGAQPQMATPSYTGPVGPCKLKMFPRRHLERVLGDLGAPVATKLGSQTPWRCQATVDFSRVPPGPHGVLEASWRWGSGGGPGGPSQDAAGGKDVPDFPTCQRWGSSGGLDRITQATIVKDRGPTELGKDWDLAPSPILPGYSAAVLSLPQTVLGL